MISKPSSNSPLCRTGSPVKLSLVSGTKSLLKQTIPIIGDAGNFTAAGVTLTTQSFNVGLSLPGLGVGIDAGP